MGKNKYGLEISLNMLNLGNMINPSWGTYKTMGVLCYDNAQEINLKTISSADCSILTMSLFNKDPIYSKSRVIVFCKCIGIGKDLIFSTFLACCIFVCRFEISCSTLSVLGRLIKLSRETSL